MEYISEESSASIGQKRRRYHDDDNLIIPNATNGDDDRPKRLRSSAETEPLCEPGKYPELISDDSSNSSNEDGSDSKDDDDKSSQDQSSVKDFQLQPGIGEAKERELVNQLLKYNVKDAVVSKRVLEIVIGPPSPPKSQKGRPKQKPPKVQRTLVKKALFNHLGRLNLAGLVGMTPSSKINRSPNQKKAKKQLRLRPSLSASTYLAFEDKAAADDALKRLQNTPLAELESQLRLSIDRVVDEIGKTPPVDHASAKRDKGWYLQGRMEGHMISPVADDNKERNAGLGTDDLALQNVPLDTKMHDIMQEPSQPPDQPSVKLRDLSEAHKILQSRYWNKRDMNALARCPICARDGHMDNSCPRRTCEHCGQRDQHPSSACPRNKKCTKCRARGHSATSCPSKLKMTTADGLTCDLCSQAHAEEECSWIWRTFRPQELPNPKKVGRVSVFCYECGYEGHYGDDCPSRPKAKQNRNANITFSLAFAESFVANPQQGRKARSGPKSKQSIVDTAESLGTSDAAGEASDPASFYGRKIERKQKPSTSMRLPHIKGPNQRNEQRPPLEASYVVDLQGSRPQGQTLNSQYTPMEPVYARSGLIRVSSPPPLPKEPPPPLPPGPPPNN